MIKNYGMNWDETEGEISREVHGCRIKCDDKRCEPSCFEVEWEEVEEEVPYARGVDEIPIPTFEYENAEDLFRKASEIAKEKRAPVVVDYPEGLMVIDSEGEIESEVVKEGWCPVLKKDPVDLEVDEVKKIRVKACFNDEKLGKTSDWYEVPEHPAVGLVTALNRPVVGKERKAYTAFAEAGIKGIFVEERMMSALNVVYENLKKIDVATGLDTPDEAAEDLARTAIHEYAHYVDHITGEEYKGGWWGETPLQSLAVALTGRPIPAGSELSSEKLAEMAWKTLKDVDPKSVEKMSRRMKEETDRLKEDVGKILDDLRTLREKIYELEEKEKRDYLCGFDITADIDRDNLEILLTPCPETIERYPDLKRKAEDLQPREKYELRAEALKRIVDEIAESEELTTLAGEFEVEDVGVSLFMSIPKVVMKEPYPWSDLASEVDIDLTAEWW